MAKKWRSKSLFGEMESLFGEEMAKNWRRNGEEHGELNRSLLGF